MIGKLSKVMIEMAICTKCGLEYFWAVYSTGKCPKCGTIN